MIKIRILSENIVTEQQEQMSLDEVIDFYDNNINSFVAMANGEQQKDPQLWKKFERIALDCYNTLQKGYDEIKKWSNSDDPRAAPYIQKLGTFYKKFTSFLKGEQYDPALKNQSSLVPLVYHRSFELPNAGDNLSDEELKKVFYVLESYTKWYENLKGKLGSWSQRNLPTVRKLLKLREGFIT